MDGHAEIRRKASLLWAEILIAAAGIKPCTAPPTIRREMMEVSKEMAYFFRDQCIGGYSGHMAEIPNSPILSSVLSCHGVTNTHPANFSAFLRAVADQLEVKQ